MAKRIGINAAGAENRFLGESLECIKQAFRGLMGGVEKVDSRAVGGLFLGPLIRQKTAPHDFLRTHHNTSQAATRGADLPRGAAVPATGSSCYCCSRAQQHADNREDLRGGKLLVQPGQMPAFDVAGFMGDDPDNLVGGFCIHNRAGINEHPPFTCHEGIETAIAH